VRTSEQVPGIFLDLGTDMTIAHEKEARVPLSDLETLRQETLDGRPATKKTLKEP